MKSVIRRAALAGLAIVSLIVSPAAALANPDRITRGEAQAVLQAGGAGGLAILSRANANSAGAPANQEVAIRPYFDSGLHYCAEDWHTIVLAYISGQPTLQEARDVLEPVVFTFYVDGELLETNRTPVKPFLNPEFVGEEQAFSFQQGALVAPGELSVGSHVVRMTSFNPEDPLDNFELGSQFYIDAAGTGVCL